MRPKNFDQLCVDSAFVVGARYDAKSWKTFSNLKPDMVGKLFEELNKRNAFVDIPEPPPPLTPMQRRSAKFGPTFAELNPPDTIDLRPTLFSPPDRPGRNAWDRVGVYQYPMEGQGSQYPDNDFWSAEGNAGMETDGTDPENISIARFQTVAYADHCYAVKPRWYGSKELNKPKQEHFTAHYDVNGVRKSPGKLVSIVRNVAQLSNDAVAVFEDGIIGPCGTATAHGGVDWPLGVTQLPPTKVPTGGITLTSSNEFVLVNVLDTTTNRGQIAVIAAEAKWLKYHTWGWIGLPSQGSYSAFKILGYIDLPFVADAIVAASNGMWLGPGTTDKKVMSEIDITQGRVSATDPGTRFKLREGGMAFFGYWKMIATGGYAMASSKADGKVAWVDLKPLFAFFRYAYLDEVQQPITLQGLADGTFPPQLSELTLPKVTATMDFPKVSSILAGQVMDRWSKDRFKCYVAQEDGTLSIIDASSLMKRFDFETLGELKVMTTLKVGRNPCSMCLARFNPWALQLFPLTPSGYASAGKPEADELNNLLHVACRGDRRIDSVETFGYAARIHQSISHKLMNDPVDVAVSDRNPLILVASYWDKKIFSFRISEFRDRTNGQKYPVNPASNGSLRVECAGVLDTPGLPFAVNSTNVN